MYLFPYQNPLRLAHDIVQSEVKNKISTTYTDDVRSLVNSMLNKVFKKKIFFNIFFIVL